MKSSITGNLLTILTMALASRLGSIRLNSQFEAGCTFWSMLYLAKLGSFSFQSTDALSFMSFVECLDVSVQAVKDISSPQFREQ